jgi:peptidoglycan/LPS O-acetylase OafA/YrhL
VALGESESNIEVVMVLPGATCSVAIDWAGHEHTTAYFAAGETVCNALIAFLSYSLYLWQQPFCNRHGSIILCAFPINVAAAFGIALASYYGIERPFLARWGKFVAATTGRMKVAGSRPAPAGTFVS